MICPMTKQDVDINLCRGKPDAKVIVVDEAGREVVQTHKNAPACLFFCEWVGGGMAMCGHPEATPTKAGM